MNKNRIFLACLDERLRIALLLLLETVPGVVVVGFTDRLQNLLAQIEASEADVLILEWELAAHDFRDLLVRVRKLDYSPKVIYFSGRLEERQQVLESGADYVIFKNAPPDELIPILDQIGHQEVVKRK
jgi:DNA-binding response OmpR family regulator